MIDITIQFNLIIFSFIYGFLFSIILDIFNKKIINVKSELKIIFTLILNIMMSIIYFIGIDKISNSIFHLYSILCIILGFSIYNIIIAKIQKK